jgi:hypothetical protein
VNRVRRCPASTSGRPWLASIRHTSRARLQADLALFYSGQPQESKAIGRTGVILLWAILLWANVLQNCQRSNCNTRASRAVVAMLCNPGRSSSTRASSSEMRLAAVQVHAIHTVREGSVSCPEYPACPRQYLCYRRETTRVSFEPCVAHITGSIARFHDLKSKFAGESTWPS